MRMSRQLLGRALALSALSGAVLVSQMGCMAPSGPLAPPFQGKANDGTFASMLDLTKSGPLLVVFIHPDDPKWKEALAITQAVAENVEPRPQTLAVLAMPIAQFDEWRQMFDPPIRVIPDPDRRISSLYRAPVSPSWQRIGPRGTLLERFDGFSKDSVGKLLDAYGLTDPAKREKVLEKAPAREHAGPSLSE